MSDANNVESKSEREQLSRPVFEKTLKVNSLQAQRVMERSFERVSNSLFSLEVILRIIGEQDEIDKVESMVMDLINHVSEDINKTAGQLNKLMEDNGIDMMPEYTNPKTYTVQINSPQVAQFANLVRKLDTMMGVVDNLWLNAVLSSKQRSDATFQWQQRLNKLAARIIGLEKRARIAAYSKGKESEVSEAAPEASEESNADEATADDDISNSDEQHKVA